MEMTIKHTRPNHQSHRTASTRSGGLWR